MCANLIIAVSHFCPLSCWCYATVREFSLHYVCQERNFAQKSSWIQQSSNKIKRLNSFIFMRIRQCFPDCFVIYISNFIEFQTNSGGNKTNVFSHSITKTCCGWISDFKIKITTDSHIGLQNIEKWPLQRQCPQELKSSHSCKYCPWVSLPLVQKQAIWINSFGSFKILWITPL